MHQKYHVVVLVQMLKMVLGFVFVYIILLEKEMGGKNLNQKITKILIFCLLWIFLFLFLHVKYPDDPSLKKLNFIRIDAQPRDNLEVHFKFQSDDFLIHVKNVTQGITTVPKKMLANRRV